MNEEKKKRIAVFRFGVIADLVGARQLNRGETERLMREKCAQKWQIPGSSRTNISESAIKEWIARYKASGNKLESLYPRERSDMGKMRAIPEETAAGLIVLHKEMPGVTLTTLMKEAKERKIILPGQSVNYAALYRLLKAEGLLGLSRASSEDRRRFESEYPNDLWQSDVMHGPHVFVEGKKRKTYLIAFIDDMSRLVPYGLFYLHERLENFLSAFYKALQMRGIPRKLYVDNGSAFCSHHLEHICASLGIVLLHTQPYQPEGRGKIERWFRNVREGFLSVQKAEALDELNDAFSSWVQKYNETPHWIIKDSPIRRFAKNIECIRPAPKDLADYFRKASKRTVDRDRTVSLEGRLYEVSVQLVGKKVTLLHHDSDPARVEVMFDGKTYGFATVLDVHVNCRVRRGKDSIEIDGADNCGERCKGGKLFKEGKGQ
jgi:transposase InsO family protein